MKRLLFGVLLFGFLFASSISRAQEQTVQIKIKNPSGIDRTDAYVTIDADKLLKQHKGLNLNNFILKENGKIIPFQIESYGKKNFISFVLDIKGKETKNITLAYGASIKPVVYKSRTYAELAMKKNGKFDGKRVNGTKYEKVTKVKVPAWHIDHDGLYKYEGPGWESEKAAYRFYLDWRNATDIYGKKTNKLVLNEVGVTDTIADNNESFHTMQDWGMDIFKVGNSFGIGSFGMWSDDKVNMVSKTDSIICEITKNGPVKSEIKTNYFGWFVKDKKYNVESILSILAGSRLTKNDLTITGNPGNVVTGLAKYPGTTFIKGTATKGWNYIALYGHQSLADDNLGIAVFYNSKNLIELTEDTLSYIVKLKTDKGRLVYYFGDAWEKEFEGIKNEKEFRKYLDDVINELNNPLVVE